MKLSSLSRYHYPIVNLCLMIFILLARPFLLNTSGQIYFLDEPALLFALLSFLVIVLDFLAFFLKIPAIAHRSNPTYLEKASGVFALLWIFRILISMILAMFVVNALGLEMGDSENNGDLVAQIFIMLMVVKELFLIVYAFFKLSPDSVAKHAHPIAQKREWLGDVFVSIYIAFAYITVWETLLVKTVFFSLYSTGEFIAQGIAVLAMFGMMVLPLQILFIVEYFSRKNTRQEQVVWWVSMISLALVALIPVFTS